MGGAAGSAGLILFAHGARDPRWALPFEDLAARIRARQPGLPLRLAYLELMNPDLAGAAAELVHGGCTELHVLPVFLGSGGHVRRDLPALAAQVQQRHAGITVQLHPPIGEIEAVQEAMAAAALASLAAKPAGGPGTDR